MRIGLAPMDGITDLAYRTICKEVFSVNGNKDDELMLWTEFMSADGYKHNPAGVIKHLRKTEYEPTLIAQIFGGNSESLIGCAVDIQAKYDFGGIELNMGCPSPKIMKCEAGSGMLKNKKKSLSIIKQISDQLTVPFSLKTRVGLTKNDIDEQFDFLVEASKYVWMIGIHGRLYNQGHSGDVDWDFIYRLKKRCPEIIVIGNGGIRSYNDAIQNTGVLDGVMIAQSAIANPWVLSPHIPSIQERFDVILRHLDYAMASELLFREAVETVTTTTGITMPSYNHIKNTASMISSEPKKYTGFFTPRDFRKYIRNYISGLPDNKAIKKMIPQTNEYHEVKEILNTYRSSLLSSSPI